MDANLNARARGACRFLRAATLASRPSCPARPSTLLLVFLRSLRILGNLSEVLAIHIRHKNASDRHIPGLAETVLGFEMKVRFHLLVGTRSPPTAHLRATRSPSRDVVTEN